MLIIVIAVNNLLANATGHASYEEFIIKSMRNSSSLYRVLIFLYAWSLFLAAGQGTGFAPLFNGKDFTGWTLAERRGEGYKIEKGAIICPAGAGGKLMTERQYQDFVLRLEFNLTPGANNGIAIRAPMDAQASRYGMEIQILDDNAPENANLRPAQYCGSIYSIYPAKRGAVKKPGEWNRMEISCKGRHVRVALNDKTIVDVDLNTIKNANLMMDRPGFLRDRGHIGFLGHTNRVEFRNIELKELSAPERGNTPPAGFRALFNGKNLKGWHGRLANPPELAQMSEQERTQAMKHTASLIAEHWKVKEGVLIYDGRADSLCTDEEFGDFELLIDWKIEPGGDSGIYLRGHPQVQIWDTPDGSGGLFNNEKNINRPIRKADKPPGEWNRFRILMMGDRVAIWLNDEMVVYNTPVENYWEKDKPFPSRGSIWLQHHGAPLYFKNIYIRDIRP
jgi:hypothetical protein